MRAAPRLALLLGLSGLLIGFFWLDPFGTHGLGWLQQHRDQITGWRDERPVASGVAYLVATIASIGLLLPAAAATMVIAGVVFGFGWGCVLAGIGFLLGSSAAFWLARRVLRDSLRAHLGSRLQPIERRLARHGGWYLVSLRLAPVVPAFLVNIAMGLSPLRWRTFVWASAAGVLPSLIVYVNAGTQLSRIERIEQAMSPSVALSLTAVALLPWLTRWVVRRLPRHRADARIR